MKCKVTASTIQLCVESLLTVSVNVHQDLPLAIDINITIISNE